MPCCCIKTLNLCSYPVCGSLVIEQQATGLGSGAESGALNNHTLVLDYFQTQITLTVEQTEGQNIHFDISALNENFEFTGQVFDSGSNLVKFTVDGIEYDCIKFKTVINVNI
jgi:hypothetical protein